MYITGSFLVMVLMYVLMCMIPAMVALTRNHKQTLAIFVLCLVSAWTGIGWIIAMIWACLSGDSQGGRRKRRQYRGRRR